MRTKWVPLIMLLGVVPAHAVVVTCVSEGNGAVRLDYSATDETVLPAAFALDLTVDGGAIIQSIYDYKVGDSTAANRGFGIFPASVQFNAQGLVSNWGTPEMSPSKFTGVQPGLGTAGVTIGMATRYDGSANAPSATGTLCRFRVDPRGASVVNVKVAANAAGGGVVLADATTARFTGTGTTLGGITPVPPPAPASITYPATSSTGTYTVRWAALTEATSYNLERSADAGTTWTAAYTGAEASYAETVPNGNYRYRVRAANSAGSSPWTTGTTTCVVSISTPPTVPPAPASITYPATSSTGTYTVSWSAATGAASYQLERSADNGSTWTSAYSGTALSYAETVPNGSYRYRVRAANSAGSSTWRTGTTTCVVSISTQPTVPPPPASITYPATSSTGTYTVSWTASTGATSYQLERSANNGSTWTSAYSGTSLSRSETVPNGSYRYRVRATNSAGSSVWKTGTTTCVVSITTPPTTGAFRQSSASNGLVSIEAEHFSDKTSPSEHSWNLVATPTGFAGTGAMRAEPDNGAEIESNNVSRSPRLDFNVRFVKTGRHYIWVRVYATGWADDSCHAGLGGTAPTSAARIGSLPARRQWVWINRLDNSRTPAYVNVGQTGTTTFNVWMREDGFRIDKIVLTTDRNYRPTGKGPTESPRDANPGADDDEHDDDERDDD